MCRFFSIDSDGKGKPYYFDGVVRKKILGRKLNYETDSHTSIADYFGFKGTLEDSLNKYEYNPLTKEFVIDQLNAPDDSSQIKSFCEQLDFSTVVPELIIKPILHPFRDRDANGVTNEDILLLKEWDSIWDSVGASVGASVWASVGDSVWASIGASIGDSVGDSVGDSIRDSVRDSVGASVWASIRDSVWDSVGASIGDGVWDSVGASIGASVWASVGAYISSFFNITYKTDFSAGIKLWEKGLIPIFYQGKWHLLGGKTITVLYKEN